MTSSIPYVLVLAFAGASARPVEVIGVVAVAPAPGPSAELVEMTARLRSELAARSEGVLPAHELAGRMTNDIAATAIHSARIP
jgi:hypothetical protein